MRRIQWGILCLSLFALAVLNASGQYITPEFTKAGIVYRYIWKDFQDAQLVMKTDDQVLQILAIRSGELQQKTARGFATRWTVNGLWHAYQNADKSWTSNGVVTDLTAPVLERIQFGQPLLAVGTGEARLAAASDRSGRLHVVILKSGDGQAEKRFSYAVRDNDNQWHVMLSDPIPDDLSQPFCFPPAEGNLMILMGLVQGEGNGSRIVKYTLSPMTGGGRDSFRWTRELFPENLQAKAFAAVEDSRTFIMLYQNAEDGNFKAVDRDVATGKWNFDPQRFEKTFEGNITKVTFRNLAGFLGRDGLPQVTGLYSGAEGVYHFYRDEIGLWHNNDAVLSVGDLKRVSACLDGQGLFNISGVTNDGRIWHGFRGERLEWRNNGLIYDPNSH